MTYLSFLLVVPIALSLLLRIVSHFQTWTYFSHLEHPKNSLWQPNVSIIVPVKGMDQQSKINFQSFCQQEYSQSYEIIFALETEDDPAVPLIKDLMQQYSEQVIKLVFSEPLGLAAVGKIKNLIAGYRSSQYEAIVLIDSDVHLDSNFLSQSMPFVAPSEAGAAFAVPVCEGCEDWIAALHNIAVNSSVLTYASTAYQNRTTTLVGSIIVTRREVIEAIGGLDAIADRIVGIDVSLGQAIHEVNYSIQVLAQPARMYHVRDTLPQYWWQIHRWLVTIRQYFPIFPLFMIFAALPLWWAFLFLGIAILQQSFIYIGFVLVGIVLVADVLSIAVINHLLVKDEKFWRFLWVALFSELFGLPILVQSLFSNRVLWRGRWLSVSET